MRKLIVFNMVTVDGFFEDANGGISWHVVDDEFHAFAIEQLDSVDTLLFGRVTYQRMASYWPTEAVIKSDPLIAQKMNETPKIVVSRTLTRVEWTNSSLVSGNVAEELSRVKQEPGKDIIIFGSANLTATLARSGLVYEYRLMVAPVALGDGRGLFQGIAGKLNLKLLSTRVFRAGNVLLVYR